MQTALLVGATGLVGGLVLEKLLEDSFYNEIIVLTRKPIPQKNPKLKQVIVDFDNLEKYSAEIKADVVFCCLGTTIKTAGSKEAFKKVDYEYPLNIAKIAKQNGATKYLLISGLGASKKSSIFYNQVKGEVQEAIEKLCFQVFHILQPSLIIGERAETRFGEGIAQKLAPVFNVLMIGGLKKYKSIEAKQIALAMVYYSKLDDKGVFIHESDKLQEVK